MSRQVADDRIGMCRMCYKTGPLEAGHVVPSFVYRWIKATSATGYLRSGENPNLRIQDGWKRRWFCRTCENRIGRFERAFAQELFPLIMNGTPTASRARSRFAQ